ncbi:MAG: HAMP domain-containing histidine kinase [Vampirovibrio sp.]|nr:HAMP domain-containing histidine kinase [Vampirovibrio sp.]
MKSVVRRLQKQEKPGSKPVVLDTITTRFLLLVVVALIIPLTTLIIFVPNLIGTIMERVAVEQVMLGEQILNGGLKTQETALKQYASQIAGYLANKKNLVGACPAGDTDHFCAWVDIENKEVHLQGQSPQSVSSFNSSQFNIQSILSGHLPEQVFYTIVDHRLYMMTAVSFPSTGVKSSGKVLIMGQVLGDDTLQTLYRHTPGLSTAAWIIENPMNPEAPVWLAKHSMQPGAKVPKRLLEYFYLQNSRETRDLTIRNFSGRVIMDFLYGLDNQRVARIFYLLPLPDQSIILGRYNQAIGAVAIASLLLSALFAIMVARNITRPLFQLIDQVKSLNLLGELRKNISVHGVHEVNQLAFAFNQMISRIRQEHMLRDEFVAALTHDLKVPLLAEKQTLTYMAGGTYGDLTEQQDELVKVLSSTNQSCLGLVNGLLEVYRYESGTMSLVFDQVDMVALMQEVALEIRSLAEEKSIRLELDLPQEGDSQRQNMSAYADRLEIKRVLTNLMSNAIINTPKYGHIKCHIFNRDQWGADSIMRATNLEHCTQTRPLIMTGRLLVSIQDAGIGFTVESLPDLFQRFGMNRGRNPMSTGLGLYNCHQVITAHNGSIWVETTEGKGAAVNFLIPQTYDVSQERRKAVDRRSR